MSRLKEEQLVAEAQEFVKRNLSVPLRGEDRDKITRWYILCRSWGYTHKEAKHEATYGYSMAWLAVAWVVLQILFYVLKKWWEKRDV